MMRTRSGWLGVIAVGLAIAIGITLISPLASDDPDGLERVAEDQGFLQEAEGSSYDIIPDYTLPGIEDERIATILAGGVGVLIVALIGFALGYGPRLIRGRGVSRGVDNGRMARRDVEPGAPN